MQLLKSNFLFKIFLKTTAKDRMWKKVYLVIMVVSSFFANYSYTQELNSSVEMYVYKMATGYQMSSPEKYNAEKVFESKVQKIFKSEMSPFSRRDVGFHSNLTIEYLVLLDNETKICFLYKKNGKWYSYLYEREEDNATDEAILWESKKYESIPCDNFTAQNINVVHCDKKKILFAFTDERNAKKNKSDMLSWYLVTDHNDSNSLINYCPTIGKKLMNISENINNSNTRFLKHTFFFDIDEATMDNKNDELSVVFNMIENAYNTIKKNEKWTVFIIGTGDSTGPKQVTRETSNERTKNVDEKILTELKNKKNQKLLYWYKGLNKILWSFGNMSQSQQKVKPDGEYYNRKCDVILTNMPYLVEHEYLEVGGGKNVKNYDKID